MIATRSRRAASHRFGRRPYVAPLAALLAAVTVLSPVRSFAAASTASTIFPSTAVPTVVDAQDGLAVELGVKFESDVAGSVSGIRFYKSTANGGTHTASLWSAAGARLASATFVGETASGWQQVNFATPATIQANTVYVASYHTNDGHYSDNIGGLTNQVNAAPLHALADGSTGANGVYAYGSSSTFPSSGWRASNYWVDIAFNAGSTVPDTTPPVASIASPADGASVSGSLVVSGTASDNVGVTKVQVSVDGGAGQAATGTTSWSYGLNTAALSNASHTVKVSAFDAAGNVGTATESITVNNAIGSAVAVDSQVVTHDSTWSPTITSPALSTSRPNEVLEAFLTSDGPRANNAVSFASVSGGGLTWTLRQRTNSQRGDAEIWQAVAASPLANVSVTATRAGGSYEGAIVVTSFSGADTTTNGAVAGSSGATGAPTTTVTTTRNGSLVWATGYDWDNATARVIGPGQTMVDQYLAAINSTFWTQRESAATPASGTKVTISDTAPSGDMWNLAAVEILPATGTTPPPPPPPPSVPTNLSASASSSTQVNLSWTASTGPAGVAGYDIYRDSTKIATSPVASYLDLGVTGSTTYAYAVSSYDSTGDTSAQSSGASATTPGATTGGGYPDATNTGVPAGTTLTPMSSSSCNWVISTANTIVNAVDLNGCIDVEASNVTIENSLISSNTWWGIKFGQSNPNVTGLQVLHNTIQSVAGQGPDSGGYDYAVSDQSTGTMEVGFNNISGYNDGTDITTGSVHDNYIHDLSTFSGAHVQDVYVYPGTGLSITHNTLINQAALQYTTAAIYIAPDAGHQNNVLVSGNLLAGGAYAFYGGDSTATNIRVLNNGFSTQVAPACGYYGTDGYWSPGNAGNVWSGNVWADGPNAGSPVLP